LRFAVGLSIAANPYHWEMCAEGDRMRGGDGGTALHAGVGTFAEWLTLSSWFYRKLDAVRLKRGGTYGVRYRRKYYLKSFRVQ
jgi:hypothetical protein